MPCWRLLCAFVLQDIAHGRARAIVRALAAAACTSTELVSASGSCVYSDGAGDVDGKELSSFMCSRALRPHASSPASEVVTGAGKLGGDGSRRHKQPRRCELGGRGEGGAGKRPRLRTPAIAVRTTGARTLVPLATCTTTGIWARAQRRCTWPRRQSRRCGMTGRRPQRRCCLVR